MSITEVLNSMGFELNQDQQEQLNKEIGSAYVPRADFNSKVTELKGVRKELADARSVDIASIENERNDYKSKYEQLQKSVSDEKAIAAFKDKLGKDCKDPDYVLFKLGGVDKIEKNDKGEFANLDSLVETAKKDYADFFNTQKPFFADTTHLTDKTGGVAQEGANSVVNVALRNLVKS